MFRKHRAFNHGAIREMELHLRDHIDDLIAEGYDEKEAFEMAVKEFGNIRDMAMEEFQNQKRKRLLPPIIHTTMFKTYFKTSFRSLMKSPLSSFINIFGLSVAIGVCLVVYAFIEYDYSIDRFHKYKDEVYLVTFFADRDGTEQQYGPAPTPLGELLREDFSHIKKVCRVEDGGVILKYRDQVFYEQVRFSDPEFLEMFTFPLKWGTSQSLSDPNSIILNEEMSVKYFGEENPVGRDMLMIFGENRSKTFKVAGVAEAFPKAHIIDFGFLVNFENYKVFNPDYDFHDWSSFIDATLIQVDDPSALEPIEQGIEKYKTLQNKVQNDWPITSFAFEPLASLHLRSGNIRNDISYDASSQGRTALPVIAIFMLALACFNYINIAIVSAAKRLKEIGVRKVMGANRGRIISQFLGENILITFVALIIGLILAVTIFLPWFVQISQFEMELKLIDKDLWIFLILLLLFTGVASGIYPAFYISKFGVVKIFRGSVQFGKKNPLTKLFLCIQLVLACVLITGAVMFTQNTAYQNTRSWGYDQREALYVSVPDGAAFEQLNAVMLQNPNVLAVSGSSHHLGREIASTIAHLPNRQYEIHQLSVAANYFMTMGLQLKAGRTFKDHHLSDRQAVVVNELLVKNMDLKKPIGQLFEIDSIKYEVIGVVEDFHSNNFYYEVLPTVFTVADPRDYRYLSLRVRSGSEKETYSALQEQWARLFPELPFQGGHQEDVWDLFFEEVNTQETFMRTVALVAILLASLGLYGLVTLNVSGRVREFSIRKVLGAGLKNIAANITKQYVLLSTIAVIIGAPVSYVLIKALIGLLYPDPVPMGYAGVAIAVVILIFVLLAVVSTQVNRVSKSNPVDGLKVE